MTTTPTDDLPTALAVLYLRVSTAGQAEGGTSLETQEATGRAEAARAICDYLGFGTDHPARRGLESAE